MSRVVVTGGRGFVGAAVCAELQRRGNDVVATTRDSISTPDPNGLHVARTSYDLAELVELFARVDVVVHMAGNRFGTDDIDLYLQHIELACRTLEAATRANVQKVVLASSVAVYSSHDETPWREDMSSHPRSSYGAAKLAVEALARRAQLRGVQTCSLRLAQVVGCGERVRNAVSEFCGAARIGAPIRVQHGGRSRRAFVYVEDAARAFALACEDDRWNGEINISGASATVLELANAFVRASGFRSSLDISDDGGDVENWTMDTSRASKLGWAPRSSLDDAIAAMLEKGERQHV